jgi:ABC-type multidrug transport system ATPase subunit
MTAIEGDGSFEVRIVEAEKRFGGAVALAGVTLSVPPHTSAALVGRNGAGKTSLLRAILGRITLDAGSAGIALTRAAPAARAPIVGVVPEGLDPEPFLRVLDFLEWRSRTVATLGRKPAPGDATAALGRVGLESRPHTRFRDLSRGQRQLVLWAAAILSQPDVLLLDEPLSHLDPSQRETCMRILAEERERRAAVLFSTHILTDLQTESIDRVCFLVKGRLAHQCSPAEDLQTRFRQVHEGNEAIG